MTSLYPAHLGGIDFDDDADANGIKWSWEKLDGWFEDSEVDLAEADRFPDGQVVTAARKKGRPIVLGGSALIPAGAGHALWFTAVETLNAAMDLVHAPGLLLVDEPNPKQAYVRRTDRIRSARVGRIDGGGNQAALTFEVPLKAADPRKYAQTVTANATLALVGAATSVGAAVSSGGTTNTRPVVTITGPATTPRITNLTVAGNPFVQWNAVIAGGDTLTIDFAAHTILLNATNFYQYIEPTSTWWTMQPGVNSLAYTRTAGATDSTATVSFRNAWS